MKLDTITTDKELKEFLNPRTKGDAAHEAWVTAELQRRKKAKVNGEMTYRSLDAVMTDFGFNAP